MTLLDEQTAIEIIELTAEDIPCAFSVKLYDRTYGMEFRYNDEADFFTVDLGTTGIPGETLCYGEVLRLGKPLFEAFNDVRYPLPIIVPICLTGEDITEITYANFGREVKLCLFPRG